MRSLNGALRRGRQAAIKRMRGTCLIERPGKVTTDSSGDTVTPWTQVYPDPEWPQDHPHADGKFYARYPGLAWEQNPEVAGATVVVSRLVIRVPFGVAFRPGDRVTIVTDPDNPQLADTKVRVASIDDQSQATAQRLICEDFQAGVDQ